MHIDWADGHSSQYPYIWLRHKLYFPTMGRADQKEEQQFTHVEEPKSLKVKSIQQQSKTFSIEWSHDGSLTHHIITELRDLCPSVAARKKRSRQPIPWKALDATVFKWFENSDLEDFQNKFEVFEHLLDRGIVFLRNVPTTPGTLEHLVDHFGPARNTHFGVLFDIRSLPPDKEGTGANIGATASGAQAPHMDEGWRHGPPGLSFFHCLKSDPNGRGQSRFVDGIAAAEHFRGVDPGGFNLLCTTPMIMAAERNPQERFRTRCRMIATDHLGNVRGIRVSDRNFPELDIPVEKIEDAYRAVGTFLKILYSDEYVFDYLLQPGELAIFDNHRVMHARRSFDPSSGERWIQQLSVDREEFHNVFRQLAESLGREEYLNWEPDAGLLSY